VNGTVCVVSDPPPTFAELIDRVEERRRTVTVHAPELPAAFRDLFDGRHVRLEHEPLPRGAGEPFLTVTDGDRYVGSVDLPAVSDFLDPAVDEVGSPIGADTTYRALTSLLPDTVFSSLDRRQLLATSREIEDRAWRVGTGRIAAGFQALSKLRAQMDAYAALAERGLDVHVYGAADWRPPVDLDVTFHADGDELGRVWFAAFDGGTVPEQACGLVAEERSPGTFAGFWTYDPGLVALIFDSASRFPATPERELP
jgi:hypothetical protein